MRRALIIASLLALATSCVRREIPNSVIIESEFTAGGTIDGVDTDFSVGQNNFYMEPAYDYTPFGVIEYVSSFRKDNGEPMAFEVVMRHHSFTLPTEIADLELDAILTAGTREYQTQNTEVDTTKLNFCTSIPEGGNYAFLWDINGSTYTSETPIHQFDTPEELLAAKLTVTDLTSGCTDSLLQVCEIFDPTGGYPDYYYRPFRWEATSSENQVVFKLEDPDAEIASVQWELQDGSENVEETEFSFTHTFSGPGPHLVSVTVTMTNGYQYKYSERVRADGNSEACSADIHFVTPPVGSADPSQVRMNFTSDEGVKYSSFIEGANQDMSYFEILSSEPELLQTSEGELQLIKLDVVLSCTLYNLDDPSGTDTIQVEDFQGTIAVAVPQ